MKKRLIIQSGDENVAHYLDLAGPYNAAYAERCGADYWRFDGVWPGGTYPAWNRLPMILDAFERGYEHVLWMDADTLVVQPDVDVFVDYARSHEGRRVVSAGGEDYDDHLGCLCMRRTAGGFYWPMDGADQWEGWNDGVLLVKSLLDYTSTVIEWLWAQRDTPPLPHHQPGLWELNWLLDYAKAHPEHVVEMDQRFNWQPFNGASPEQYAVIKAWHGLPHSERWSQMRTAVTALGAGGSTVANVRDTTPGFVG